MSKEEKRVDEERLPVEVRARMLSTEDSLFLNVAKFEHAQRVARVLSESTMVPDHFKGNVGNCLIALNLAQRMGVDVFMLLQSIYVVHGRPGIEGKLVIALIEGHGRFGPLHFKFSGDGITTQKVKRPASCIAYAVDLRTKETITGPEVTWDMVVAEGWNKGKKYRDGSGEMPSKWETMPELMFTYRAASFFGRVHDPGALMGFRSLEEVEEIEEVNITPETPKEKEDGKKAKLEKFFASWPKDALKELVEQFLERTAQANRTDIEGAMILASDDLERFWSKFEKFKAQKAENDKAKREEEKQVDAAMSGTSSEAPNPPIHERQTASAPPPEEKPKGNGIPDGNAQVDPVERVRFLEKTYPKIFKEACQNVQIAYPMTESAAILIRDEAVRLFKLGQGRK